MKTKNNKKQLLTILLVSILLNGLLFSSITSATTISSIKKIENTATAKKTKALFKKGKVHKGYATYYGGGYRGGCALLDPIPKKYYVTALNLSDYNTALLAGAYLQVKGKHGKVKVLVTDLLPEGKKGDLDLNESAFPKIDKKVKGKVKISWKIIPFPTKKPIRYKFKEGSSPYWCGIQIRNHVYPIAKLEYKNKKGKYIALKRTQYNYFESSKLGAGPYTFRVTDIYGNVLIDKNIPLSLNKQVSGKKNFPK